MIAGRRSLLRTGTVAVGAGDVDLEGALVDVERVEAAEEEQRAVGERGDLSVPARERSGTHVGGLHGVRRGWIVERGRGGEGEGDRRRVGGKKPFAGGDERAAVWKHG